MKTIAIDTSLSRGSVAAMHGDRVAVRWLEPAGEHARLLADAIASVTAALGWRPANADLVAVVRGPGSFTGLRVGVTTAKALAWATGCRLLGISGCETFARAAAAVARRDGDAAGETPVHVAYDAGRGELFTAIAMPDGRSPSGWRIGPGAITAAAVWVGGLPPGVIVAGPAVTLVSESLARRPDVIVATGGGTAPSAADVAALAVARAAAGDADDPAELLPEYMRQNYADEAAGGAAR